MKRTRRSRRPRRRNRKRDGFSYLNPASWFEGEVEKPATQPAKPTAAETATAKAVVEGVDKKLRTGEPPKGGAPKPPVSALPPEEKETGPAPDDPAKVIGDIDTRLGGEKPSGSAPKAPGRRPRALLRQEAQSPLPRKPPPRTKPAPACCRESTGNSGKKGSIPPAIFRPRRRRPRPLCARRSRRPLDYGLNSEPRPIARASSASATLWS